MFEVSSLKCSKFQLILTTGSEWQLAKNAREGREERTVPFTQLDLPSSMPFYHIVATCVAFYPQAQFLIVT